MQPNIVMTHWVHQEVIELLSPYGNLLLNQTRDSLPPDLLLERAATAHALMAFMPDCVDEGFLQQCPHLKIIAAALKGYDNFDVAGCTRHGVWFTCVEDLLTVPTAELAVALMLSLIRKIGPGDRWVRSGRFQGWRPIFYGMGLENRKVGIIGMGSVGRAIAQRLNGFGSKLLYADPFALSSAEEDQYRLHYSPLAELLKTADIIVGAAPLTEYTRHLIDATALRRMKPGSFLVNVGRGSVVDETAVAEALEQGRLAGYAADVFEMEDWALNDRPRTISPTLLDLSDKTVFTPHLGSAVDDVRKDIALEAARNIVQVLSGEPPAGAVNQLEEIAWKQPALKRSA